METIRLKNKNEINTLNGEDVKKLHSLLTFHSEILKITEPVSPAGVKNINMLESAVQRQHAGLDDYYVYDNVFANCATLVYGIACNHAFHNGNKRAALLCLIMHLYKNGYVLQPMLSNDEIYEFLRSIAAGELEDFSKRMKEYKNLYNTLYRKKKSDKTEANLKFIEKWIQKNSESKNQTDRQIRWVDLFKILNKFGITHEVDEPGQKIILTKKIMLNLILFKLPDKVKTRTYPYKGIYCSKYLIKGIKRDFNLSKEEGLDNVMFYAGNEEAFLDYEIQLFKKAIYKLSKN